MLRTGILIATSLSVVTAQHCEGTEGIRQSPINIDPFQVEPAIAKSLKWSPGYYEIPDEAALVNDGYTLKLTINQSIPTELSGGLLDVPYEFQQLHFHWGDSDGKGSEHKIKGSSYPIEMHVVHSQSSSNDTDDTVVVAYFFRKSLNINRGLQNLLDAAIIAAEDQHIPISVEPFALSELLSTRPFTYYTYKGSLTTPPYKESVTWIVASTALPISESQLAIFRKAGQIDKGLVNNFRCIQNLNGRRIGHIIPFN